MYLDIPGMAASGSNPPKKKSIADFDVIKTLGEGSYSTVS